MHKYRSSAKKNEKVKSCETRGSEKFFGKRGEGLHWEKSFISLCHHFSRIFHLFYSGPFSLEIVGTLQFNEGMRGGRGIKDIWEIYVAKLPSVVLEFKQVGGLAPLFSRTAKEATEN